MAGSPLVQSVTRVRTALHQIVPISFLGADGGAGFGRGGGPGAGPGGFEPSLTEAPAPSLLHIEVKMALMGFIGTRSEHGAEDAAGVIVD